MAEFENDQNMEQVAQEAPEAPEAEGNESATLDIRNASARSFHIIKKRYNLPQENLDSGVYYYLQSKTRPFDAILRRSPTEVNKETSDFKVPLGATCMQAVVSLYGLSNGMIYSDERWQQMLKAYNDNPCGETALPLLSFLKAAATVKCIEVSGGRKSAQDDEIGYCQEVSEVDDKVIVTFFMDMIR